MSMQRHDVASTLRRRCINVMCPLGRTSGRRGGSNEYPQSMLFSRNKTNNVYPCKPQLYYIKVGFKGSKLCRPVSVMREKSPFVVKARVSLSIRAIVLGILCSSMYSANITF